MSRLCPATIAALAAIIVIIIVMVIVMTAKPGAADKFWTQYGGAIPPDEQARRFDAAEKGVPDMAWAEAYWPPNYCSAQSPVVFGKDTMANRAFGRHRTHSGEPDDYYAWFDRPSPYGAPYGAPYGVSHGMPYGGAPARVDPQKSWCWCECPAGNVDPAENVPYAAARTTGRLCRCPCV